MSMHVKTPRRGVQAVYAEGSTAALVKEVQKAFHDFKAENDRLLKQKANARDVVSVDKVNRINAAISDLQAKIADMANQRAGAEIGGGGSSAKLARRVAAFSRHVGRRVSVDEYKAYAKAFPQFLRKGPGAGHDVHAAMSVVSDPDGGYTVTPDVTGRIVKRIYETSPMRQVASVVTISTDSIEGFNDLDEAEAGWVGETQSRPETATPGLGKWSIPVHIVYANPRVTQKLLDDSSWSVEAWLAEKVASRMTRKENEAFLTGNGDLKPRGLLTYPTAATADAARPWGTFQHINSGANGAFAASNPGDVLVDVTYAVKTDYRAGASWMMARSTLAAVRKLKDGQGNYLWQPNFQEGAAGLLLGYPVVEAEDMPAMATGAHAIAFGDFKEAYTIVDREGIRVLRDPFTVKPFTHFYTTKRTGGGAINFEAVKFVRFSA